jgi:hypothetical protein
VQVTAAAAAALELEDTMPLLQLLFEQEGRLPWLSLLPPAFIA